MKAIFKGNKFAIQWTIKDAVTSLPFDFTGMFVEYILYSDNYKGRIVGATTNINKMQAEIPANILPVGVYNIICKYRNSINEGHCIYRNAFQITRNPEFIGCDNVVVIESFSAPLKLENMDINYLGHFTSSDLLIDCNQPSWALVGKLNEAEPWFFYTEDAIPAGSQYGWNNMSEILGTYNLTEDKVSIYDFNLITEYNVSRNHTHTERKFSPHWGATTKYYPEYEEYSPCKIYEKDERVNMPGYTENSFIALHQTSDAPYEIINETSEFSFSEAINLVPEEFRFPGIRMTYVKKDTHQAETWFYKGGSWENKNSWVKPDGNVTINNLPDEEDIASIGDNAPVLKLKDKVYNPQTFSGLGRTYLRKNMINSKNVLNQAMFTNDDGSVRSNTRYIIQYDYDLNGATITVPLNSILQFEGGSFSNGTVVGNKTVIEAGVNKIFNTDITISGTWNITEAYAEWFGAVGDGISDDRLPIQKSIDSFNTTKLLSKKYMLLSYTEGHTCLVLPSQHVLCGVKREESDGAFVKANIVIGSKSQMPEEDKVVLMISSFCTVENIGISGDVSAIRHDHSNRTVGITHKDNNVYRITIKNVDIWSCYYALNMSCWMSRFEFVICRYNLYGFVLHGIIRGLANGIWDIYSVASPDYQSGITSVFISNCYCNANFLGGFYITELYYSTVQSCGADGCGWFSRSSGWGTFPDELKEVTLDNTYPAYRFKSCNGVKVVGCGAEEDSKAVSTYRCSEMEISTLFIYNYSKYKQIETGAYCQFSNIITSDTDVNVVYKDIYVNIPDENLTNNIIYCVGSTLNKTNVLFKNIRKSGYGFIGIENIYTKGHMEGSVVRIENNDDNLDYNMADVTYPSVSSDLVYGGDIENLREYLNTYYKTNLVLRPRKIIVDFKNDSDNACVLNGSIIGYNDVLHIKGTDEISTVNLVYDAEFRNFKSIIFENLNISHASGDLNFLIAFNNCGSVSFINCKFTKKSVLILKRFFKLIGTSINFENCENPDKVGNTSNRPLLTSFDKGWDYYDTDLNKMIIWDGSSWVNMDGSSLVATVEE